MFNKIPCRKVLFFFTWLIVQTGLIFWIYLFCCNRMYVFTTRYQLLQVTAGAIFVLGRCPFPKECSSSTLEKESRQQTREMPTPLSRQKREKPRIQKHHADSVSLHGKHSAFSTWLKEANIPGESKLVTSIWHCLSFSWRMSHFFLSFRLILGCTFLLMSFWITAQNGSKTLRVGGRGGHMTQTFAFFLFFFTNINCTFITEVNVNRGAQCLASGMEGDLSAILPVTDVKQQAGAGEPSGDGQRKGDCCRWASLAFLRLPFWANASLPEQIQQPLGGEGWKGRRLMGDFLILVWHENLSLKVARNCSCQERQEQCRIGRRLCHIFILPSLCPWKVYRCQQTALRSMGGKHPHCLDMLLWQPSAEYRPKKWKQIILQGYGHQDLAVLCDPFFPFSSRKLCQEFGNLHLPTRAYCEGELSENNSEADEAGKGQEKN